MLVLTRKKGERFFIDTPLGEIEIVVTSIHEGKVRIGIAADRSIPIRRSEVTPRPSGHGRID